MKAIISLLLVASFSCSKDSSFNPYSVPKNYPMPFLLGKWAGYNGGSVEFTSIPSGNNYLGGLFYTSTNQESYNFKAGPGTNTLNDTIMLPYGYRAVIKPNPDYNNVTMYVWEGLGWPELRKPDAILSLTKK